MAIKYSTDSSGNVTRTNTSTGETTTYAGGGGGNTPSQSTTKTGGGGGGNSNTKTYDYTRPDGTIGQTTDYRHSDAGKQAEAANRGQTYHPETQTYTDNNTGKVVGGGGGSSGSSGSGSGSSSNFNPIGQVVTNVGNFFNDIGKNIGNAIGTGVQTVSNTFSNIVADAGNTISYTIKNAGDALSNVATGGTGNGNFISDAITGISNVTSGFVSDISNNFSNNINTVGNYIGGNIIGDFSYDNFSKGDNKFKYAIENLGVEKTYRAIEDGTLDEIIGREQNRETIGGIPVTRNQPISPELNKFYDVINLQGDVTMGEFLDIFQPAIEQELGEVGWYSDYKNHLLNYDGNVDKFNKESQDLSKTQEIVVRGILGDELYNRMIPSQKSVLLTNITNKSRDAKITDLSGGKYGGSSDSDTTKLKIRRIEDYDGGDPNSRLNILEKNHDAVFMFNKLTPEQIEEILDAIGDLSNGYEFFTDNALTRGEIVYDDKHLPVESKNILIGSRDGQPVYSQGRLGELARDVIYAIAIDVDETGQKPDQVYIYFNEGSASSAYARGLNKNVFATVPQNMIRGYDKETGEPIWAMGENEHWYTTSSNLDEDIIAQQLGLTSSSSYNYDLNDLIGILGNPDDKGTSGIAPSTGGGTSVWLDEPLNTNVTPQQLNDNLEQIKADRKPSVLPSLPVNFGSTIIEGISGDISLEYTPQALANMYIYSNEVGKGQYEQVVDNYAVFDPVQNKVVFGGLTELASMFPTLGLDATTGQYTQESMKNINYDSKLDAKLLTGMNKDGSFKNPYFEPVELSNGNTVMIPTDDYLAFQNFLNSNDKGWEKAENYLKFNPVDGSVDLKASEENWNEVKTPMTAGERMVDEYRRKTNGGNPIEGFFVENIFAPIVTNFETFFQNPNGEFDVVNPFENIQFAYGQVVNPFENLQSAFDENNPDRQKLDANLQIINNAKSADKKDSVSQEDIESLDPISRRLTEYDVKDNSGDKRAWTAAETIADIALLPIGGEVAGLGVKTAIKTTPKIISNVSDNLLVSNLLKTTNPIRNIKMTTEGVKSGIKTGFIKGANEALNLNPVKVEKALQKADFNPANSIKFLPEKYADYKKVLSPLETSEKAIRIAKDGGKAGVKAGVTTALVFGVPVGATLNAMANMDEEGYMKEDYQPNKLTQTSEAMYEVGEKASEFGLGGKLTAFGLGAVGGLVGMGGMILDAPSGFGYLSESKNKVGTLGEAIKSTATGMVDFFKTGFTENPYYTTGMLFSPVAGKAAKTGFGKVRGAYESVRAAPYLAKANKLTKKADKLRDIDYEVGEGKKYETTGEAENAREENLKTETRYREDAQTAREKGEKWIQGKHRISRAPVNLLNLVSESLGKPLKLDSISQLPYKFGKFGERLETIDQIVNTGKVILYENALQDMAAGAGKKILQASREYQDALKGLTLEDVQHLFDTINNPESIEKLQGYVGIMGKMSKEEADSFVKAMKLAHTRIYGGASARVVRGETNEVLSRPENKMSRNELVESYQRELDTNDAKITRYHEEIERLQKDLDYVESELDSKTEGVQEKANISKQIKELKEKRASLEGENTIIRHFIDSQKAIPKETRLTQLFDTINANPEAFIEARDYLVQESKGKLSNEQAESYLKGIVSIGKEIKDVEKLPEGGILRFEKIRDYETKFANNIEAKKQYEKEMDVLTKRQSKIENEIKNKSGKTSDTKLHEIRNNITKDIETLKEKISYIEGEDMWLEYFVQNPERIPKGKYPVSDYETFSVPSAYDLKGATDWGKNLNEQYRAKYGHDAWKEVDGKVVYADKNTETRLKKMVYGREYKRTSRNEGMLSRYGEHDYDASIQKYIARKATSDADTFTLDLSSSNEANALIAEMARRRGIDPKAEADYNQGVTGSDNKNLNDVHSFPSGADKNDTLGTTSANPNIGQASNTVQTTNWQRIFEDDGFGGILPKSIVTDNMADRITSIFEANMSVRMDEVTRQVVDGNRASKGLPKIDWDKIPSKPSEITKDFLTNTQFGKDVITRYYKKNPFDKDGNISEKTQNEIFKIIEEKIQDEGKPAGFSETLYEVNPYAVTFEILDGNLTNLENNARMKAIYKLFEDNRYTIPASALTTTDWGKALSKKYEDKHNGKAPWKEDGNGNVVYVNALAESAVKKLAFEKDKVQTVEYKFGKIWNDDTRTKGMNYKEKTKLYEALLKNTDDKPMYYRNVRYDAETVKELKSEVSTKTRTSYKDDMLWVGANTRHADGMTKRESDVLGEMIRDAKDGESISYLGFTFSPDKVRAAKRVYEAEKTPIILPPI